jgi:secreted trypsin-like serine protease
MTARDSRLFVLALAFALVPALGACNRDAAVEEDTTAEPADERTTGQALRVTEVEVGSSVGPDGRVNDNATSDEFRPNDTIYASVNTEGNATGATLVARWTYQDGQVVDETSRTISGTGPATTEFHISKPDGFPVGKYKVEIRLNGQTTETKEFEVK